MFLKFLLSDEPEVFKFHISHILKPSPFGQIISLYNCQMIYFDYVGIGSFYYSFQDEIGYFYGLKNMNMNMQLLAAPYVLGNGRKKLKEF